MLNNRIVILSVALLAIFLLAAMRVYATTVSVSIPPNTSVGVVDNPEAPANQKNMDTPRLYRFRLDEDFDVALRERASLRQASKTNIFLYRSRFDESFDLSLREQPRLRDLGKATFPSYRSLLNECFDMSIKELYMCHK